MKVLLIPAAFALLVLTLARRMSWREAWLCASLIFGVFVVLSTELLSAGGMLTQTPVAALWTSALVVCAAALWHARNQALPKLTKGANRMMVGCLVTVAVVSLCTAITAVFAPPNNWDSMTYHLGRVAHWVANGSVNHYPTSITRQLWMNPGAEYILTHVIVLSQSDRWVNLLQWFAMCGCLAGVSLIARDLGARAPGQALAALFAATIPMGILQASSTQNDWVVSLWLVCLAWAVLRPGLGAIPIAAIASSLGLALVTKITAWIYAPPLLLFGLVVHRRAGRRLLAASLATAAVAVALNAPHLARNMRTVGNPFGIGGEAVVRWPGPRTFTSAAVRNLASHALLPWQAWNTTVESLVRALSTEQPRATFEGTSFSLPFVNTAETSAGTLSGAWRHEDHAGNLAHLLLALPSVVLALRSRSRFIWYLAAVAVGFCAFSLVLRWQPWGTRLQLPAFVLFAPLAAVWERTRLGWLPAALLFIAASPFAFANTTRPLIGPDSIFAHARNSQYLRSRPELTPHYLAATRFLSTQGYRDVGLIVDGDAGEYPLHAMLRHTSARLRHVAITTPFSPPTDSRAPQAVLVIESPALGKRRPHPSFAQVWSSGPIHIFERPHAH